MCRSTGRLAFLLLALCVEGVASCSRHSDEAATQVVARVNSKEITVHQINYLLSRMPNVTPERATQVKREILNRLIDDELARQQAIKNKLDRSPDVLQAMEFAKTEVLARSYVRQITAALPRPTDDEVKRYYAAHPDLFAQRRVFSVEEILFTAANSLAGALRDEVAKARSMQDIASWLKVQQIKFSDNRAVLAAEQVPLQVLPRLQAMKDGQIEVVGADNGRFHLVQVIASKRASVDETTAAPRIRQYLFNRRVSEAVAADMERIRKQSKIQYMGEFAADGDAATRPAEEEGPDSKLDGWAKELFR